MTTVTYIAPTTGGYEAQNGKLIQTQAAVNKVNRLLSQVIGQDMINPTYGNPLLNKKQITASDIYIDIPICLTPLINTGEVSKVGVISVSKKIFGRWAVEIEITLPSNYDPISITWTK